MSVVPPSSPLGIGDELLDHYEIIRVHKGAMGQVFICIDRDSGQHIAAKTFQDIYMQDILQRRVFVHEAETWIRLERHPNIVQAHFVERIDGKPYLFLEAILTDNPRGPTIKDYMFTHTVNVAEVVGLGMQFCDGMIHANNRVSGIVHRDIKPENIMISGEGILKITDFGLVKSVADPMAGKIPKPSSYGKFNIKAILPYVRGTPAFIAPEQILDSSEADVRSDIYSFGCVLYELLARRIPLVSATIEATLLAKLEGTPTRIRDHNTQVPHRVDDVVLRCLEREPNNRFQNFNQLHHELNNIHEKLFGVRLERQRASRLGTSEKINKAVSLIRLGRTAEAIRLLDSAVKADPNHPQLHCHLGRLAYETSDIRRSEASFRTAISLKDDYAVALNNLGVLLESEGDHAAAIDSYQKAVLCPEAPPEAYFNLAQIVARLGLTNRAVEILLKSPHCSSDPTVAGLLGTLLQGSGQAKQALPYLETARAAQPENRGLHFSYACALQDVGRLDEAEHEMDTILLNSPAHAGAFYHLGLISLLRGDLHDGLLFLEKAINIQPSNADAHLRVALVYSLMHFDLLAQKHIRLARELGVDTEEAASAVLSRDGVAL